jgi:ribosomal protein L31
MKKIISSTFVLSTLFSYSAFAQLKIESNNAPFYEGKNVIACGELKQVTRFKRGLYLNLDANYPRQSLTLVVWEDDLSDFNNRYGAPEKLINDRVCGKGKVTDYKGRSQISLYNAFSFSLDTNPSSTVEHQEDGDSDENLLFIGYGEDGEEKYIER